MKRLLALVLTILILVIIYSQINRSELLLLFRTIHIGYFILAMLFFLPQILVASRRWQLLAHVKKGLSLWESSKLILAGNTLNVVLPSKAGDMAKAFFLKTHHDVPLSHGTSLVVIEKVLDVGSLTLIMLFGILLLDQRQPLAIIAMWLAMVLLLFILALFLANFRHPLIYEKFLGVLPPKVLNPIRSFLNQWMDCRNSLLTNPLQLSLIVFYSLALWFLHMSQIFIFFWMFGYPLQPNIVFGLVPMAIFFGLLPITIGGIGTRDSALIYLFNPYLGAPIMAAIGIFCSIRYIVPALLGLPFFNAYMISPNQKTRDWQEAETEV